MTKLPVTSYPHPINTNLGAPVKKEEARKRLGLKTDGKYLLFFGLIRKYKGLDLLINSLASIGSDVTLIIAGEFYEPKEEYLKLIEGMSNLMSRVIIHDHFIPDEDVPFYFSAADLLTLTYLDATQSGVTQMAMHYNLPMLVTDVGALSEYVRHQETGYVVSKDKLQIAEAINDFFENNRNETMSSAIAVDKVKYDWNRFAEKLIGFAKGLA